MTLRLLLVCAALLGAHASVAEVNKSTGRFSYDATNPFIDNTLGQIAFYLIKQDRREGLAYVSPEVRTGIAGYELRFIDNGSGLPDGDDQLSVRRFTIPIVADTLKPDGYWREDYVEYVDSGLNGIDNEDHYLVSGRRFDLKGATKEALHQHQTTVETAITAFVKNVDFRASLPENFESRMEAAEGPMKDGSLPGKTVLGLDLRYLFRPIEMDGNTLNEEEMLKEVRAKIGFVYSATLGMTDTGSYRLNDLTTQTLLLQRTYDPAERVLLQLVIDTLFDRNGDGIIEQTDISAGYVRFRELHQELSDLVRGQGRRVVLPSEKISKLRQEYESVRGMPYSR